MRIDGLRILVTGGAGFIGSHIVEDLVAQGAEVTVYDNLSTGSEDNIARVRKHVRLVKGDILDYDKLERTARTHQVISHQAAQLEIGRSQRSPEHDLRINTVGTLNVLAAARHGSVELVVNASSACVYGQTDTMTSEEDPTVPNWEYGVSKLSAEHYTRLMADRTGIPAVSLRYAIVYGEREWFRRVLPVFIKRAITGMPLVIFGSASAAAARDFVYVGDVVKAHQLCIKHHNQAYEVYNVGSGRATTVGDLARLVKNVCNPRCDIVVENIKEGEYSRLVTGKQRNASELRLMLLDCRKARQQLGWSPDINLKEGIRRASSWALQNPHRWQEILGS